MNLVFTYIFNDLFINSFDFSKLSSLNGSLDTVTFMGKLLTTKIQAEGIGTWTYNPQRNSKSTTKHLYFFDIFDKNNIVIDEYKDEPSVLSDRYVWW